MVIKTILIFLIALLGYSEWLTGTSYLQRPIVLGPLVGLVMGDMVTGTIMGATMELAMVGAISVGAYNPPDTISGTILGVSLAMQAGADASAALTLGIPIATIVLALDTALGQPVMLLLVHRIDKNVEDGDTKAITRNMLIAGYAQSWCGLLIIPLAFFFGADAVASLLNIIPDFVQTGMDVAAASLILLPDHPRISYSPLFSPSLPFPDFSFLASSDSGSHDLLSAFSALRPVPPEEARGT